MPKVTPEVLDWNKQWYPVHAVEDLDTSKAHAITLLGIVYEDVMSQDYAAGKMLVVQAGNVLSNEVHPACLLDSADSAAFTPEALCCFLQCSE